MTTRAVAARAGLPHGAVSYHFRGKQELLTEAALHTVEEAFPLSDVEALENLADFVGLFEAWVGGDQGAVDPVMAAVGVEAMLEAERNPALRTRLADTLRTYRQALADVARAAQGVGSVSAAASPAGLAALLVAAGDGLFLHARLDPDFDSAEAVAALRALVAG